MNKILGSAVIMLITLGSTGASKAKDSKVLRGSAMWTINPPAEPACGPFSALLVQSTQADVDVVEVIYQFGNTCGAGSFASVQGSGAGMVSGKVKALTVEADVPMSDGRTISVDLVLTRTKDLRDNGPDEKVVSASAFGTVILDGTDLTRHAPSTDATITETKTR
jgi:hypothetical protein